MDLPVETRAPLLLEREDSLSRLSALGRRAAAGRGVVAVVEAAAGMGKTTLLAAAADSIQKDGLLVLPAGGSELERGYPFGIVRQLFERTLADGERRAHVLTGGAALASMLVPGAAALPPTDSTNASPYPMLHALYWLVANLCREQPVTLMIDDAHEADQASLRFVSFLARRAFDLPLFLLAATRPIDHTNGPNPLHELHADSNRELITLHGLSHQAVSELARTRLGQRCEPAFALACHEATGGNPFYLQELLREISDRDLEPTTANAAQAGELSPPVIVRALLFRLAAMRAGAIPLARACAVLGVGAQLSLCARLAAIDMVDASRAADALIAAGVFAAGQTVAFAHPILRAAVLADLGTHELARWHAAAANVRLESGADPQVVGLHLLRTEPTGDARVVETLRLAARAAALAGAPTGAVDYLRRAMAEPPSPDGTAQLLFDLGVAEVAVGDPLGLDHLHSSVAETADPVLRARRALVLADHGMKAGRIPDAVTALTDALVGLDESDEDLILAVETERYWIGHLDLRTSAQALQRLAYLRASLEGPDSATRRRLACYLSLDAARLESREAASSLIDRALAPPGLLASQVPGSTAVNIALLTLCAIERHDEFDALAEAALAVAGRSGAVLDFVLVSTFRAIELGRRGELLDLEASAREALSASALGGWRHGAPGLVGLLATSLFEQGRLDDAAAVLAEHPYDCEDPADYPTALLLDVRGRLRVATGAPSEGLADLLRCGQRMQELGVVSPSLLPWRSHAALAHRVLGHGNEAIALAREELQLARRLAGPIAIGVALRVLALVTSGSDGIALLHEAQACLDRTPNQLEQARVRVDLGAALRRAGHVLAAREGLRAGFELATGCHAGRLAAQAHDELLAAGARPRRAHEHGPEALTASELRVARLAAKGLSNTAIAQMLFISRKTVEKHLAGAYRKLDIQSRAGLELAALDAVRSGPVNDRGGVRGKE